MNVEIEEARFQIFFLAFGEWRPHAPVFRVPYSKREHNGRIHSRRDRTVEVGSYFRSLK